MYEVQLNMIYALSAIIGCIFGNHIVKIWNSLPATVEDFSSIHFYPSRVDK